MRLLPKSRLDDLLRLLTAEGYEVVGPRVEAGCIVLGPLHASSDLPLGWKDHQSPGRYELERDEDAEGRWRRFPFFYTLLALTDIDWKAAREELRYAAPAMEKTLGRLRQGAEHAPRRRALLERALAMC